MERVREKLRGSDGLKPQVERRQVGGLQRKHRVVLEADVGEGSDTA